MDRASDRRPTCNAEIPQSVDPRWHVATRCETYRIVPANNVYSRSAEVETWASHAQTNNLTHNRQEAEPSAASIFYCTCPVRELASRSSASPWPMDCQHQTMFVTSSQTARRLSALRVLRAWSICDSVRLTSIFWSVIIIKQLCTSCAWWDFTNSSTGTESTVSCAVLRLLWLCCPSGRIPVFEDQCKAADWKSSIRSVIGAVTHTTMNKQ